MNHENTYGAHRETTLRLYEEKKREIERSIEAQPRWTRPAVRLLFWWKMRRIEKNAKRIRAGP